MSNALSAWTAGFTRRWHTHPQLCDTVDYNSGHQQRVAILMLSFKPDVSRDAIIAAMLHDQGERDAGDMAYPVKQKFPEVRGMLEAIESESIANQGFDFPKLGTADSFLLTLCDWLDSYLWMLRHFPKYSNQRAWRDQLDRMSQLALELDLHSEFIAVTDRAERMFK